MAQQTPLWLQQGSYPASYDRGLIGALWPGGGVTGMAVGAGSGMTVTVAVGTAAVPTPNNTGATLCVNTASVTATITAAPPSGQNRYDVVTVLPRGNDLDGGANNDWIVNVIAGTAAATPTVPTVPAGQLALAQVYVPGASASVSAGNITDRRTTLSAFPNQVRASIYRNAAGFSVPQAANTLAPFDTVDFDPLGMFNGSNGLIVTVPGVYLATWSAVMPPAGSGAGSVLQASLYRNGARVTIGPNAALGGAPFGAASNGSRVVTLAAADLVQVNLYQTSGAANTLTAGRDQTFLGLHLLSV